MAAHRHSYSTKHFSGRYHYRREYRIPPDQIDLERVRISGGQRQRICIARALYKQASVLIFDEATSALDNETEQVVMQAIEGLSKDPTLLIIAHGITTWKNCDAIIKLDDCKIATQSTYDQIVSIVEDS